MVTDSIKRLLIIGVVLINFYLISYKSDLDFKYNGFVFIGVLIFILVVLFPKEILNISGHRIIVPYKKFEWIRLVWLLPAGIELIGAVILEQNRPQIFDLDVKYYYSLNYALIMFLIRDRHLVLTRRFIKQSGSFESFNSKKIYWDKIKEVKYTTESIMILSDSNRLDINIKDLSEKSTFRLKSLIEKNTKAQHTTPAS